MERRPFKMGLCTEYSPLAAGSIDGTDEQPHDCGVVRALSAKYKPNKSVAGDPDTMIFVSRLNPRTSEETLKNVFSKFGEVKGVRLVRDIVTGFSKCYAFVEFYDKNSAEDAQKDAYRIIIDDREIFVDFECERKLKGWVPRRLGGGFGGKKESGQLRFGGRDRPFREPIVVDQRWQRYEKFSPRGRHRDNREPVTRSQQGDRSDWQGRDRGYRNNDRHSRDQKFDRYTSRERDHH